jgi:hypothetical protein
VKAVRAVVSTTPVLAEMLQRDWQKAVWFYARSRVTGYMLRHGVPSTTLGGPNEVYRRVRVENPGTG